MIESLGWDTKILNTYPQVSISLYSGGDNYPAFKLP